MFEVPQRQQLASERTSLTLFAPAPSTISFVPLTRNLSLADPSPYLVRGWTGLSDATATRFPVLRTTKCDAFSEALGAQNRLLWYGRDIRYRKRPPTVRDASSSKARTAEQPTPQTVDSLLGYATHFQRRAVPKAAPCRTGRIFSARNGPRSLCSLRRPLPLLLRRHSGPETAPARM